MFDLLKDLLKHDLRHEDARADSFHRKNAHDCLNTRGRRPDSTIRRVSRSSERLN